VFWMSSDIDAYNNIVASCVGTGMYNYASNNCNAIYNDVWNNTVDYDGISPGVGSISMDPLFVGGDPFSYELSAESPCIDAGDPSSPPDPDGSVADMGAFPAGEAVEPTSFDIAEVGAAPGQAISVPIVGAGFEAMQIGGIEFHIAYDAVLLTFDGISSSYLQGAQVNALDGVVHIVWEGFSNPIVLPDSDAILDLNYTTTGPDGSASPLTWQAGSEVVDHLGNIIDVGFLAGGVSIYIPHSIGGGIVYYDLIRPVEGVSVCLSGNGTRFDSTDSGGLYTFEGLGPSTYTATPENSQNANGVTVLDVVNIQRHLAYIERLNSPYKYIAADANGSGNVSIADVVKIARFIAELDALPVGNWVFIDASYNIDEQNWNQAPVTREVDLQNLDITDVNFVGIRVGDIDNSWGVSRFRGSMGRLDDPGFCIEEVSGEPGSNVTMNIRAIDAITAAGLEFHIQYPIEDLTLINLNCDAINNPLINHVDGTIHLVWSDIQNLASFVDDQIVLEITFEIHPDAPNRIPVDFLTSYTVDVNGLEEPLVYVNGAVQLITGFPEVIPVSFGLSQNYPNPFNATTSIDFSLASPAHVSLDVFDCSGRKVSALIDGQMQAGPHRIIWNGADDRGNALSSGVYIYRLRADGMLATRQMMLLK